MKDDAAAEVRLRNLFPSMSGTVDLTTRYNPSRFKAKVSNP